MINLFANVINDEAIDNLTDEQVEEISAILDKVK